MHQYEKHMVGYLDLLGAKSRIESDAEGEYLRVVYNCYKDARILVSSMHAAVIHPFRFKIFSDNLIVALPSDEKKLDNNHPIIALNRMSMIIGALQRNFLKQGILVRGSIALGDLFINDLMVFGDALVKAYELESNYAKFPRILVSEEVQEFDSECRFGNVEFSANRLRTDTDGLVFLDYLNYPADPITQSLIIESCKQTKKQIAKETDGRILEKLHWHLKYLDSVMPVV